MGQVMGWGERKTEDKGKNNDGEREKRSDERLKQQSKS